MTISGFDHVAMPVERTEAVIEFYKQLGFAIVGEEAWRNGDAVQFALQFGDNKINVHPPARWTDPAFTLRGPAARPGCGDFCFVWDGSVADVMAMLDRAGAVIELGPVRREGGRNGGTAVGTSVYTRDPDGNLLEFIVYE